MIINKKIIALVAAFGLVMGFPVLAEPPVFSNYNLITPGVEKTLVLPTAAEHSNVIYLGSNIDPASGKAVEGYAIIHHKKQEGKGGNKPEKPGKGGIQCYDFLARGAKWKNAEQWIVNPANLSGLDGNFVLDNLTADIEKWETAAGTDILGNGSSTGNILIADTISPDGSNEVYFADVENSGAIAVTIVWGIFGGKPSQRELVEWDMVFDDVDFDWSPSGEADKMDFENIATHELGHSAGMKDLYDSACSLETMFGYADFGETIKRDLHTGDITGISKLY